MKDIIEIEGIQYIKYSEYAKIKRALELRKKRDKKQLIKENPDHYL